MGEGKSEVYIHIYINRYTNKYNLNRCTLLTYTISRKLAISRIARPHKRSMICLRNLETLLNTRVARTR